MRRHDYFVYIMTNFTRTVLYVGMTNDLTRRVAQHKRGDIAGFTQRYHVQFLVHFAHFREVRDAIACEKRVKGWTRAKKMARIEELNPAWDDLSAGWLVAASSVTSAKDASQAQHDRLG
ncbi:MAG: GIY-YIG nuclease family protein [Verrucomicrobia bacterium]|nr:GIY-YIG nuclease family protein [Verrucomicrobiota bacterium]MBV9658846.1 GIY-YIG nuclease family protein [Verrucomicrobiota bacterium]